jgi:hypothetical protein
MNRKHAPIAAAALLAVSGIMPAADGPTFAFEVTPLSQYVWRGVVEVNGPVLQTSSTVTYRGAHVNIFSNQDLAAASGRRGKIDEVDFDVGYDYVRNQATLSAGAIRYTFPNTTASPATELYAGIGLAGPLNPSVRGYFDVGAIRGSYWSADVSHGIAVAKFAGDVTWEAVLAAGVGCGSPNHNAAYYGVGRWALADLHPAISLPLSRGKFRLTPKVGYGMLLGPALHWGAPAKAHGFDAGVGFALAL